MKTAKLFLSPLHRAKSRRDDTLLTVCFSLRAFSLRTILLLALVFFTCANLSAQVTIGGLEEAHKGSVLDLNSTVKGGLLLSNVVLDDLYTIPAAFPGMSTPPVDVEEKFQGAIVYHTGGNSIPAGIYVWNGTNWSPATENCIAPTWTLNAPLVMKVGENGVFSIASDASPRCAEEETYAWFKSDVNTGNYSNPAFGSAASVITSFAAEGIYKVKATVTSPYSSASAVKEIDVTVTADGAPDQNLLTYTYGIVGETCLDVKKSAQGKSQDVFNARKDAFADGFTKKYRFVHTDGYRDLALSFYDPDRLVAGIVYPPSSASGSGEDTIRVTFKSDVKDLVPANGDSLTVKLYASYKPDNTDETKYAYLEIRVEDGTCICPARKNYTEWVNFMCHNLGGEDIISSSQLITRAHHGDWYRFGAKNPSVVNLEENDGLTNWTLTTPPAYSQLGGYSGLDNSNWDWPDALNDDIGNPCPAGWRLPDVEELAATVNISWGSGTNAQVNPPINLLTNVPASWETPGVTEFSNLKKSGDYLYLPASGARHSNGFLYTDSRGYVGNYWTGKGFDSNNGRHTHFDKGNNNSTAHNATNRVYGISVRCVQAE